MSAPATLDAARAASDLLLQRARIPIGDATELPPTEGDTQWRLAIVLQMSDAERAAAATLPGDLL